MRKIFVFIFLLISLNTYAEIFIILQDGNIRTEPSTNSSIVRVEKKGGQLNGTIYNENWIEIIDSDGSKYYIHKSLVRVEQSTDTNNEKSTDITTEITTPLIVVAIILLLILIYGFNRKCPNCKKWFARKIINSQTIDREQYYKTVVREDIHKNKKGEEIGRTKRNEQVHMIKDTNRVFCECKKCGHLWTYLSFSEREG